MIKLAEAVRFDGTTDGGRNKPLKVAAQTSGGEELDVFLKPSGRPEVGIEGMANELIAACLAGHLGLPVCEPVLVHMSPEWIASIEDHALRVMLTASCPLAFASTAAGNGWRRWGQDDRLLGDRRAAALNIFTFDAFTENRDRVRSNSNLLVKGNALRVIDHEMCFRIRMLMFPKPEPWRVGYLKSMAEEHVFTAHLKGSRYLDLTPLKSAWSSLSDDALSVYEAALPVEWADAAEPIRQAVTHLKAIRDRIDECLAEVGRVLA